jgi:predicted O-methyltransferase YrrM
MNINDVPGYFSGRQQLEIMKLLYKYNYSECVGVEVGCLHGRSSIAISIAINKGTLYFIDKWDGSVTYESAYSDEFIAKHKRPGPDNVNTLETFVKNTESQKNIIPICGYSPQIVQDWSTPIDFIFLDASHTNPNDKDNIDFWLPKIKPGGMFLGHDWCEDVHSDGSFPDVNLNVEYMEDFLKQKVTIIPKTSIWYFTLPKS